MRSPISRPALPRASSAMSGFFFCGSIDEPGGVAVVERGEAELLGRPQHPLLAEPGEVDRRSASGRTAPRRRWSRSPTASSEFSNAPAKPSSAAVNAGSSGSDEPASAPAPSGDTSRRSSAASEPVDVAAERPAVGQQVVREQHRLGALQVGVAGEVDVAGRRRLAARSTSCRPSDPLGDDRAARACTTAARRSRDWSLRLRPVCSLAPAGPASSVTRRSTAVWMSSSRRRRTERAARQLGRDGVERGEHGVALVRRRGSRRAPGRARGRVSRRCRPATAAGRTTGSRCRPSARPRDHPRTDRATASARRAAPPGPRAHESPARSRRRVGESLHRRSTRRRRTAGCRRRPPSRSIRSASSDRGPTRPRGRSPAGCAARRGRPSDGPRPPTPPSPAAGGPRGRAAPARTRGSRTPSRRRARAP